MPPKENSKTNSGPDVKEAKMNKCAPMRNWSSGRVRACRYVGNQDAALLLKQVSRTGAGSGELAFLWSVNHAIRPVTARSP